MFVFKVGEILLLSLSAQKPTVYTINIWMFSTTYFEELETKIYHICQLTRECMCGEVIFLLSTSWLHYLLSTTKKKNKTDNCLNFTWLAQETIPAKTKPSYS